MSSPKAAIAYLSHNRKPHHRLVLVTGVFDLLHREHQKFLRAAKQQGDILLVGLESDIRVKHLKGPHRPVNPQTTRLENLKKLNLADFVFILPEEFDHPQDHHHLIAKLKPDILAVSSHTPNLPQKKRILKKLGAQVKIVHPHNPNISTSKLIDQ